MAFKFEITDEELKDVFENDIKKTIKHTIKDGNFEYWVRKKVHERLADDIINTIITKLFTKNEIKGLFKEAILRHVDEKYGDND